MIIPKLKEQLLRHFGDEGAETLDNYITQIHYTAHHCILMLFDEQNIEAVLPEVIQDCVVIRNGIHELHQIKTRVESQKAWTNAEVIPILSKLYTSRLGFPEQTRFTYFFVSDHMADNETSIKRGLGSLFHLKNLLAIEREGQTHTSAEQAELLKLEQVICPKIQEELAAQKKSPEELSYEEIVMLLHNTVIATDCDILRSPEDINIRLLNTALNSKVTDGRFYSDLECQKIYDDIIMMIVKLIINTRDRNERRITAKDVLNCVLTRRTSVKLEYPDLKLVPGSTRLEKKVYLGSFDMDTEYKLFRKLKIRADMQIRRYKSIGGEDRLQVLAETLVDEQQTCRDYVCRVEQVTKDVGPAILRMLKPRVKTIAAEYTKYDFDITDTLCLGLLWRETHLCRVWWHSLKSNPSL